MRNKSEYFYETKNASTSKLVDLAYRNIFRHDFNYPGFIVFDFGHSFTSVQLRRQMVDIKNGLSNRLTIDKKLKLNYQWMGRFNQQETTKFHRDSSADQSFLMLGYEPSDIKSRLFFADYMQFANSVKVSAEEYFEKYNPIFMDGEKLLEPYITEIEGFDETSFKIVMMNNSNSSETIGVLHKALIVNKNSTLDRVINSTMICSADLAEPDPFTIEQQNEFVVTELISKELR